MLPTSLPHIEQQVYGNFRLTDAVRPGPGVPVPPQEGYRISRFRDVETSVVLPVIGAAASADKLFDLYLDLLEPLGEQVHVVLETSHDGIGDHHDDLRRSEIDLAVLKSHFCDYEDMLMNDGCAGVAVIASGRRIEVQLDEHKLLFVYARELAPFRRVLKRYGVPLVPDLRLIAEAQHLHHSHVRYVDEFQQLAARIGAVDFDTVLSDESDTMGW